MLARIQELEQTISNMKPTNTSVDQQQSNRKSSLPSATSTTPYTNTQSNMFQSPPKVTSSLQPPDVGHEPKVPISALVDYQRGVLKLHDIRVIDAYRDNMNTWRYTAVTLSNTIVKDLLHTHMTNICTIQPTPFSTSPEQRQQQQLHKHSHHPTPPRIPRMYNSPFQNQLHPEEELSQVDSTSSDPMIVFVSNQYRYPKTAPTLSRVNYSYITDKASKWNIMLQSEQMMKPFYDTLVNRMNEAGVLLKPWDKVTKDSSLSVITKENCENYKSGYNSMAQALFNYLDDNKSTIFRNYTIPMGYIEGF